MCPSPGTRKHYVWFLCNTLDATGNVLSPKKPHNQLSTTGAVYVHAIHNTERQQLTNKSNNLAKTPSAPLKFLQDDNVFMS